MNILVSGFEPFGSFSQNSTSLVLNALNQTNHNPNVVFKILPTSFEKSWTLLKECIESESPNIVLALGQAADRQEVSVERIAINYRSASIPDNDGFQPQNELIEVNGPVGYWTGLPIQKLLEHLNRQGIQAKESLTAGSYVCNELFYRLMHFVVNHPQIQAGFIHIPKLKESSSDHQGWLLADLRQAVNAIISGLLN